jgi:hypothetical protein
MAVNLSPVFGVAGQLFDNNGNPLAGGKIFTYLAGTTTPAATYTSSSGAIAHSNPIVLDGAGRVPSGEIWLTDGITYKFVVEDAASNLIGTYDNLTGINSNFVAFTNEQEIQTATAGQTVFNLATVQYQPGTNSLSVFVDGVNQYGPGAQYAYVETDSDTVTFVTGLHVGASVKFTTSQLNSSGAVDAQQVSYVPPYPNSVATNVEVKLSELVMRTDFSNETDYLSAAAGLSTGGFWMDELPQPRHWRFADRVFIGNAASQTTGNKFPVPYAGTFLTTQMNAFWMERGATTLSVSDYGEFGGLFAARSSDKSKSGYYGDATIGVAGVATNDDTSGTTQLVWAGYFEANRDAGADTSYGIELAIKNKGSDIVNYPNLKFPGGSTIGIWLAGGGDASYYGAPANPSTCAILIGRNSSTWNKGIVFTSDGITGTDGVTGVGTAIAMARGHVIGWYNNTNSECANIFSTADDVTKRVGIQFANDVVYFTNAGSFGLEIDFSSGADNYMQFSSESTSNSPVIVSKGLDTNIDLRFQAKGNGHIRFGAYTGTPGAITGYIEIKDFNGTIRKLAVIS